jgi:acetamidase/formamidase
VGSHTVGADKAHRHNVFDNSLAPILRVAPADSVRFECPPMPLPRSAGPADLANVSPVHPHTIVGPVFIEGARPGHVLVVDVLEVELGQDFGHTFVVPGLGLRTERFPEPYVHNFELGEGAGIELAPGVRIPLRPFLGIMGVAPADIGEHSTIPPRAVGGNIDIARLTAGSTLYLPVEVEGALFSCGDGHAAQGRGEVCGTGIEAALNATLRFGLDTERKLDQPAFRTPDAYATTAVGPDLHDCSARAVDQMIDHLVAERGLSPHEAYVLCSTAVDLAIEEIVDTPNWIVSATLPLTLFA